MKQQPDDLKQIASFEESHEFNEFAQREQDLSSVPGFINPYFIPHDSALRDTSIFEGREVLNFGSYNYVAMSGDPEVNQAAIDAIDQYGTSASGSRLLAGEKTIHRELEQTIAQWKHTEDAIVLVSGHATNVSFVGNICGPKDLILYDLLSHNSIAEGIRLSRSDARPFGHNNIKGLESILKNNRHKYEKVLIVIEGVYSMDGDIAPVPEFVRLKKEYGCMLMVDEAHSAGVIGEHGGGVDDYFGLAPDDVDIKMGTLSKALGTCGGYLAGSAGLIHYLRYNLPGFVFSVGLSPPLAAASMKAVEILQREPERVQRLHQNIEFFSSEAKRLGFDMNRAKGTAILPIVTGRDDLTLELSMRMLGEGISVPPALYPAVLRNKGRLRFCVNSLHTEEEITMALETLKRLMDDLTDHDE
ncbi:MAG: aminotransferase class I/II-fold pyridoxal phosphate-dependent enzyme [Tissierellia bacterium]|nr:aminotransferase class I/II-fold pyridoxal phosphate-dependent enzyme [Tissierellia bacterium]